MKLKWFDSANAIWMRIWRNRMKWCVLCAYYNTFTIRILYTNVFATLAAYMLFIYMFIYETACHCVYWLPDVFPRKDIWRRRTKTKRFALWIFVHITIFRTKYFELSKYIALSWAPMLFGKLNVLFKCYHNSVQLNDIVKLNINIVLTLSLEHNIRHLSLSC